MLVKFGYCCFCDNGPDKKNRDWVKDLITTGEAITQTVKQCTNCSKEIPNKNLIYIEINIARLG